MENNEISILNIAHILITGIGKSAYKYNKQSNDTKILPSDFYLFSLLTHRNDHL